MKKVGAAGAGAGSGRRLSAISWASMAMAMIATPALAQETQSDDTADDAIVVTGIRSSLQSALVEKRESDNIVEVIEAEDIGKLPDQNLAEVLENVTGIQITREAGVGSKVQIRGTDENRTEINGVSTVGSGAGRGGIARDINRPDFDDLSTSVSFGTGPNTPVPVGNPDLVPEAVWSYDLSGEWYFAPSSFFSLGIFHKSRSNLFSEVRIDPLATRDANGGLAIDITPPCEGGGIFNPIADRNINNVMNPGTGICVPVTTTANGQGTTTQTGVEVAFQYDLSQFEDALGFASGFGFIGNYTYQKTGGSAQDFASNFRTADGPQGAFTALGLTGAQDRITLPNLSKHSYNATLYFEKYGLSARARYTWRSAYVSEDSFFFGLPRINGARGQLNASINYDINDNINIGSRGST